MILMIVYDEGDLIGFVSGFIGPVALSFAALLIVAVALCVGTPSGCHATYIRANGRTHQWKLLALITQGNGKCSSVCGRSR